MDEISKNLFLSAWRKVKAGTIYKSSDLVNELRHISQKQNIKLQDVFFDFYIWLYKHENVKLVIIKNKIKYEPVVKSEDNSISHFDKKMSKASKEKTDVMITMKPQYRDIKSTDDKLFELMNDLNRKLDNLINKETSCAKNKSNQRKWLRKFDDLIKTRLNEGLSPEKIGKEIDTESNRKSCKAENIKLAKKDQIADVIRIEYKEFIKPRNNRG